MAPLGGRPYLKGSKQTVNLAAKYVLVGRWGKLDYEKRAIPLKHPG